MQLHRHTATPLHRLAPSSSPRRRGPVSTQAPTKPATPNQTPTTTDAGLKHHRHDGVEYAATSTHRYTATPPHRLAHLRLPRAGGDL
ncbi:hypothetical protein [Vibrio gallicus]|uniref:hypothetical protein n=1 Tax=Vibrio gallicus TaxID=190897 RepID=UPI0021C46559|nr:hypothetical protein [Vibrio gallicus]